MDNPPPIPPPVMKEPEKPLVWEEVCVLIEQLDNKEWDKEEVW